MAATEMLLQDVLMEQAQNQLTIEIIQKRVADHYQIRHSDMTSKRRPANIAFPRQVAMFLSRELTNSSLSDIGDAFGGKDHSTVMYAVEQIDLKLNSDPALSRQVQQVRDLLQIDSRKRR